MNDRFVSTKIMVNVPLKMHDGVELMCDVIRPDTADPLPTILVRTAYLKEHIYCGDRGPYLINAFEAAARGLSLGGFVRFIPRKRDPVLLCLRDRYGDEPERGRGDQRRPCAKGTWNCSQCDGSGGLLRGG